LDSGPVALRHSEGCHGVHGPRAKGKQAAVAEFSCALCLFPAEADFAEP